LLYSEGTYVCNKLTPAETALDDTNWAKLQSHNEFLAGRMETISQMAYHKNKNLMQEYGIPNWSQQEWREMVKENQIEYKFASNFSVTYNGFHNKSHQDNKDVNGWTYGIFSYIAKQTGDPIPLPSTDLGHGFFFQDMLILLIFQSQMGS